jgi:PHP family Zn ribbon phosphoesterase
MEEKDLRDLLAEERSRGTSRPRRAKQIEVDRLIREGVAKAIRQRDVRPLLDALRKAGWRDDSPEFVRAVKEFEKVLSASRLK